jgi:tetratricopeptide (TPR) repeat protein
MWTWRRASRRAKPPDSHGLARGLPIGSVLTLPGERFEGHPVCHRWPLLIAGVLVGGLLYGSDTSLPAAWGAQAAPPAQAHIQAGAGWRLFKRGDYRGAERAFSQAVALAPDEPAFYVGLGASEMRLSKEEEAALALARAIRLDPLSTMAHELLGDLHARRGEWAAASEHYGIAVRLDPNDVALQARVSAAQRSRAAEAGFDSLHTAHFTVKFRGATDRMLAREVADRLEGIYNDLGAQWGYFPVRPIGVVLYPPGRLQAATLGPPWVAGLFDGTLRLSGEALRRSPTEAQASLRHEYTHAVVYELSGGRAPAWLSEGLAQCFERGRAADRPPPAAGPDHVLPLYFLQDSFSGLPRRAARQAYAGSRAAARALIERHGLARIRDLLEALGGRPDFARVFEGVLHERLPDFESEWMNAGTEGRF